MKSIFFWTNHQLFKKLNKKNSQWIKDFPPVNFPILMAIVNATPDSFYDGSSRVSFRDIGERLVSFAKENIPILDIGGESSRPGAEEISIAEEKKRVIEIIHLSQRFCPHQLLSVDSVKPVVVEQALKLGVDIVNDISAGEDSNDETMRLAIKHHAVMILMHRQGKSKVMQDNPHYQDTVKEIVLYLQARVERYLSLGGRPSNLILDPGIGFGKRLTDNLEIIRRPRQFSLGRYPVLIGASMKNMIGELTNRKVEMRAAGNIGLHLAAFAQGAQLLRIHDPIAMKDALICWNSVANS